jgi:citrate lyase beta subunit
MLDLDVVVLDLEDGVALNKKNDARKSVSGALQSLAFGRAEKAVRINSIRSGFEKCAWSQTLFFEAKNQNIVS